MLRRAKRIDLIITLKAGALCEHAPGSVAVGRQSSQSCARSEEARQETAEASEARCPQGRARDVSMKAILLTYVGIEVTLFVVALVIALAASLR
jgi:hypothetical protein